jgi:hypothetical protein
MSLLLSRSILLKAFEGALLIRYPILLENHEFTEEHGEAIRAVQESDEEFRDLVLDEFRKWPLTNKYFRHLAEARLKQKDALFSELIQLPFPRGPTKLEERLTRTCHIANFEAITSEAHAPSDPELGEDTDEIFSDAWAEVLVADILIHRLDFEDVEKLVRRRDQPCVDFTGRRNHQRYAIEVARIRRRDFEGTTLPGLTEDCRKPKNLETIEKAVRRKLSDKNEQMGKFRTAEESAFDRRMVALKTSQWEFQDCREVIAEVAGQLASERLYAEIDELLLIYDVENFNLIQTGRP